MSNEKKILAKRFFLDAILCVFIFVFLINGYKLLGWAYDNYETDRIIEDIYGDNGNNSNNGQVIIKPNPPTVSSQPSDSSVTSSDTTDASTESSQTSSLSDYEIIYQTMYKDLTSLKAKNKDTKGWIKVAGLPKLDYPFVQHKKNNQYYLLYDFNKKRNDAGWVFAHTEVNFEHPNPNNMFTGHARLDGSMFGSLRNIFKKSWYSNSSNHYVFITTETDELVFQIFSAYHTDIYSGYDRQIFTYEKQFDNWVKNVVQSNEVAALDYGATTEDIIITLNTCNGAFGTIERIAVHAKLVYSKNDPTLESYKYEFKELPDYSSWPSLPTPSFPTISTPNEEAASSDVADSSSNTASV
ncbi:MAG: class B sortase [Clostridia bacterium]|nr:class B sortase [Clostridia bacterium]